MKDVESHHSEFQQHSVTRRITLRYCGVLRILHAVPQISSSVLRHNTGHAHHEMVAANSWKTQAAARESLLTQYNMDQAILPCFAPKTAMFQSYYSYYYQ